MKEGERCNVKLKVSSGEGPTRPRFVDVPSAQGRWRWRRTVLEVLRVWDRGELWSFMAGCRVGMVWGEHGVGQPETTVLSQSFSPRPDTQSRAHFSLSRWESELSVSFFFSLRSRSRVLRVAATRVLHPPILLVVAIILFPFNVTRLHAVLFGEYFLYFQTFSSCVCSC